MNASFVIRSRLDLLIRLTDTTTGAAVNEANARFWRDGEAALPERRGDGMYVFINTGREDFLMRIAVYGYEDYEAQVVYEGLDSIMPTLEVFLIPSERILGAAQFLSFQGTLSNLKEMEALNLSRPAAFLQDFKKKTLKASLYGSSGGQLRIRDTCYGLLYAEKQKYEKIVVKEYRPPLVAILMSELKEEFKPNTPIYPIITGRVGKEGDFLLRIRDAGGDLRFMLRYVIGENEYFKELDFRNLPEPQSLLPVSEDTEERAAEDVEASETAEASEEAGKAGKEPQLLSSNKSEIAKTTAIEEE